MDEHTIVEGGRIVNFEGGFVDHNLNDLTVWTTKHNHYATREAIDVLNEAYGLLDQDPALLVQSSTSQRAFDQCRYPSITGIFGNIITSPLG
jgi:hypothetical protein